MTTRLRFYTTGRHGSAAAAARCERGDDNVSDHLAGYAHSPATRTHKPRAHTGHARTSVTHTPTTRTGYSHTPATRTHQPRTHTGHAHTHRPCELTGHTHRHRPRTHTGHAHTSVTHTPTTRTGYSHTVCYNSGVDWRTHLSCARLRGCRVTRWRLMCNLQQGRVGTCGACVAASACVRVWSRARAAGYTARMAGYRALANGKTRDGVCELVPW